MSEKTEIIVIAPAYLLDLAEAAAKEISNLPGLRAAFFEVTAFLKKPLKPRPVRFFISLGDTDENEYTKQVLPCMIESYQKNGACISYNSTHAIVFGETEHGITDTLKQIPGEALQSVSSVTDTLRRLPGDTLEGVNTLKNKILSKLWSAKPSGRTDPSDDINPIQCKTESISQKPSGGKIIYAVAAGVAGVVCGSATPIAAPLITAPLIVTPLIAVTPVGIIGGPLTALVMKTASDKERAKKENTRIALRQFLENYLKELLQAK
jgi:hypothetical protein